jgi:hypothetical protein
VASLRQSLVVLSAAAVALLSSTAPASASFHLIRVREVYPGSASEPAAEYVELQMSSGGQEFVGGHALRTYDASGTLVESNTLASDVPSGANQRTVLLATPEAEAHFGVAADGALSPSGQLLPGGGAVCWESLDCVSWGSFSGSLPSAAGQPAAAGGIPDGMALRRSISQGCGTLLEEGDDTDNSAADFSAVFPDPRPNSAAPAEHGCAQSPMPAGNHGNGGAPQTKLKRKPARRTRDRTPTFRFTSSQRRSRFLCKVDRARFRPCRSPFTTKRLTFGRHVFRVKARAADGATDRSPASWRFTVLRPRHR